MYEQMKENPAYLIDYKTYLSTIDEIHNTAEAQNATHANDVFLVALEEFKAPLMKRKEARAIVKEYQVKQEEEENERLKRVLGEAHLEASPLFDGFKKEKVIEVWNAIEKQWSELEEVEQGDNAKALVFYITRNCSILTCIVGEENMKKLLNILTQSIQHAFGMRIDE